VSENGASEVAQYDLPERRLALAGASLSRRLEQGQGIWRLEFPREPGEPLVVEQRGGPVTPPNDVARVLPAFLRGSNPERLDPAETNGHVETPEDDDPIGRLRAMLERQYAQILRHDPGVRLDLGADDVHRMRVAARRARAILRAARPVLDPSWSEPLRDELKWLGSALGRRRDIDVLTGHLQGEIEQLEQPERTAAASLIELLAAERETAQAIAVDALTSDRYFWLLDGLEAAARGPRVQRGEVSLAKLAAKEFKRLRKAAERLGPDATDEELHRARILGKRARYTAELAEDEVGKPARTFVERAKELQDVLGAHQDAIVAEARLRGLLADSPSSGAAFAAGRLVERERRRRAEARAELPAAWRELERAAKDAWS
jgi:CHAD domain-containing protein